MTHYPKELEIFKDLKSGLWGIRDLRGRILYEPQMTHRMAKNLLLIELLINDGKGAEMEDPSQYLTDTGNLHAERLLPILIAKFLETKIEVETLKMANWKEQSPGR